MPALAGIPFLLAATFILFGVLIADVPSANATDITEPRAIFNPDGSFAFCLAEKTYPDQRKLTMAMSPADEINLGLTVPKGNFKIGSRYDLTWQLDAGVKQSIQALGIEPEAILLQFGKDPTFLKSLTTAKTLNIGNGARQMNFALPSMPALVTALQKCSADNKGKTDTTMAKVEAAMPEALKALLVSAGVKDIAPLTMDNIPANERPADFVWKTGNLLGGVRERMMPKDKTLDDLIGSHIQGLKKQCSGSFKADLGRLEKIGGLALQPALVTCTGSKPKTANTKTPDHDVVVAVLFYLTAANRFTVFAHEGKPADRTEALRIRDGIAGALRNLATEMSKQPDLKSNQP